MKKQLRVFLACALALGLALGLSGLAAAAHHAVNVKDSPELGKHLVDAKGMTLYWFTKDQAGQSACAGDCLTKWPVYFRDNVAAGQGLKPEDFGTITRADGAKQSTFRGYPLYYFFMDKAAGEAKGHKVNNVWFVIDPGNFPPK
jgi:predicted lipoprotein with Yx(FWY)xxD motif